MLARERFCMHKQPACEAASFMAKHPTAVMGRVYILPVVKLPWDED